MPFGTHFALNFRILRSAFSKQLQAELARDADFYVKIEYQQGRSMEWSDLLEEAESGGKMDDAAFFRGFDRGTVSVTIRKRGTEGVFHHGGQ